MLFRSGNRSIGDPSEIEEERRLAYVGITRAKQKLYILCAKRRMLFGSTQYNPLSRFAKEIPKEIILPAGSEANIKTYVIDKVITAEKTYTEKKGTPLTPILNFAIGMKVRHKAFGVGEIIKTQPMGGDKLLEINFVSAGTKRLMEKIAAKYMVITED